MKGALHRFGFGDTNRWGEGPIERATQIVRRDGSLQAETCDLGESVDAGVGAAGTLRERGFSRDAAESCLELALDGGQAGLHLPALKGGAVVGQSELPVLEAGIGLRFDRHWSCLPSG